MKNHKKILSKGSKMGYLQDDNVLANNNPYDIGHIYKGTARPSYTCPYTCIILNQNVNGLGGKDDKLEKIIETMIDHKIHGYCLQET